MKAFAALYADLDATNRTGEKQRRLVEYFRTAPAEDAVWVLHFLMGRRPARAISARRLAAWACEAAGIRDWLFEECYSAVGDLAETIALLLPSAGASRETPLHECVEEWIIALPTLDESSQRSLVLQAWGAMDAGERMIFNKLITGGFRVGVSHGLVVRALAEAAGAPVAVVSHRLMGDWKPAAEFLQRLLSADDGAEDVSRPYPFFLAHPLEGEPASLGERRDWQVEWKWDGIRAQLIRREGRTFVWSRGEDLATERYPELERAGARLPEGTVIDGEILPVRADAVLPFSELQRRIGRKALTKRILEEIPVVLRAYDLLESGGMDRRAEPLRRRREELERLIGQAACPALTLSPILEEGDWTSLDALRRDSRSRRVEGLMLKRLDSPYRAGRMRGDWWKWKVDPFTVDAVLVAAQPGSGKRASLLTDYTFAVWDGEALTPFAKAYSGLSDAEIRRVDAFIRRNTVEKFGPVRSVRPELVFELGFEAIARSPRHRSGVAVRFPRILRWREDKPAREADDLASLRALLPAEPARRGKKTDSDELPLFRDLD